MNVSATQIVDNPVSSALKIRLILADQQLEALLQEADTYQRLEGYENLIKAAFFYNVALAFCDQQLQVSTPSIERQLSLPVGDN